MSAPFLLGHHSDHSWQSIFLAKKPRCAIILSDDKAAAMKNRIPLLAYILLNILIAAATTLTVLWLWERNHPHQALPQTSIPPISNNPDNPQSDNITPTTAISIQPTITFVSDEVDVRIRKVIGAGDLEMEYVEIYNQSDGPLDLSDWQLTDENGNIYLFPALILNSEGAIKVYSKKGTNSVIELYWQADAPIWAPGETVILLDNRDNRIATYSIP